MLASLVFVHFAEQPPVGDVVRFNISSPESANRPAFALPDGRRLAFTALGYNGLSQLWVRTLDSLEARPVPGTERAAAIPYVFWSPDNGSIAFWTGGKLKRVAPAGGPVKTVCDAPNTAVGGSWSRDDVIVFGNCAGGLMRAPAAGGTASPITILDASRREVAHEYPSFLSDGRHFLYARRSTSAAELRVGSLDAAPSGQDSRSLGDVTLAEPAFVPSTDARRGHFLFVRQGAVFRQEKT